MRLLNSLIIKDLLLPTWYGQRREKRSENIVTDLGFS